MSRLSVNIAGYKADLEAFLAQFRDHYISCDLIRIGGDGDGGYLLPDVLHKISCCFSAGVGDVANFERELSQKFDIKSFMADASVEKPPLSDSNFDFIPKFLGSHSRDNSITLSDWLGACGIRDDSNLMLQMDIEGGEFDVLIYEDSTTLSRFSVMIIEFHGLQKLLSDKNYLAMFTAIFDKVYKNFSICHVHPNNCCGVAFLDEIGVPRVIEVTFIRNDWIDNFSNTTPVNLPHPLDCKNVSNKDDVFMPIQWWQKDQV